ncbi:type II toxin-antitoxin system RelE/ParE family toxin [Rhizobium oryzicola]|uniref:Type II toxin-antitoxin system RelE/ParE family toxin n=1 Tax=Rhizobium oryzicola TaxID=1232668 RepID=A0ABT8SSV4_9HYPH|nr:type II toxin-antitoxin system RelE/ParE family toxin [Rhizobium oryzicola]MDO1581471.1 type II toxin-antitoxin system RelE/ParE family toxin [Rhizobium oryzicola]
MQRLPVNYRAAALSDLQEIYLIVLEISHNSVTARGFVERIMARCLRIGAAPKGGRKREDLHPDLYTVPFERKAVIAYVIRHDAVEITNIFYGGRDYEALYRDVPEPE